LDHAACAGTRSSGRAWLAASAGPAMPTADAAAAKPVKARVIVRIRVLSCSPDGSANRRLDRTPRLPLTRVVDRRCSPKTTTLCSACGSCLLLGASTTTDSGGAELNAPGMRIGPPTRRVGTPHPRVPGRRAWEVITPESCLPRSWSTSWLQGRPGRDGREGRPASNAGQRRRADDNSGHPLRAETVLDAGLISRYDVPPSQHR